MPMWEGAPSSVTWTAAQAGERPGGPRLSCFSFHNLGKPILESSDGGLGSLYRGRHSCDSWPSMAARLHRLRPSPGFQRMDRSRKVLTRDFRYLLHEEEEEAGQEHLKHCERGIVRLRTPASHMTSLGSTCRLQTRRIFFFTVPGAIRVRRPSMRQSQPA